MNMKNTKIIQGSMAVVAALLLLGPVGCEVDSSNFADSKRGESCTRSADCVSGLACVQGMCTLDEFPIAPSARTCTLVECEQASECCAPDVSACQEDLAACTGSDEAAPDLEACSRYRNDCTCRQETATCDDYRCGQACTTDSHCCPDVPSAACSDLADACEAQGGFGLPCDAANTLGCNCDPEAFKCTGDGTCEPRCTEDEECGPHGFCVDGACVACQADGDCPDDFQCVNSECIEPCEDDTDCAQFESCDTTTGQCEDVGCQTDRECVAWQGNVLARCNDGTCEVPCESDNDCDNAFSYGHQKCVSGVCEFIGCETNEECKLLSGRFGPSVDGAWQCMAME